MIYQYFYTDNYEIISERVTELLEIYNDKNLT